MKRLLEPIHFTPLFAIVIILAFTFSRAFAQDKIILTNGDVINGEVEYLEKNILVVGTPYSNSDFKIDWKKVEQIYSPRIFFLIFSDKRKFNSSLNYTGKGHHIILTKDGLYLDEYDMSEIVIIDPVGHNFRSRFGADLSFGFSQTKANNNRQLTMIGGVEYLTEIWKLSASFNFTDTQQDGTEDITRNEGGLRYRHLLKRSWFAALTTGFLSNTEQNIALRNTYTPSIGNYLIRDNRLYFSLSAGVTYNIERFSDETPTKSSTEGNFRAELNVIDIENFNFNSTIEYLPSLAKENRSRVNVQANLKYDFPLDLFIKFSYSLNYDSNPPNDVPPDDYVLQTTIGWEY